MSDSTKLDLDDEIPGATKRECSYRLGPAEAPEQPKTTESNGREYPNLRPFVKNDPRLTGKRTRAERLSSKSRRLHLDALRMLRSLIPEAVDAVREILTDRRVAPATRLEAARLVLNRVLGPEALSFSVLQQNNIVNQSGDHATAGAAVRSPLDDLPLEKRLAYMRSVAEILVQTQALVPPEPVAESREANEVEVSREGEEAAPGGEEAAPGGEEAAPGGEANGSGGEEE